MPQARPQSSPVAQGEIRTGWLIILAAAVGVGCGMPALPFYTIGALTKPLAAEFGWSRSDIQSAILFSTGLGALAAPFLGRLVDRHGPRAVAMPCLVGLALSFAAAAVMDGGLMTFYGAYALMALLGAGTTPVTWTRAIADSFEARRGLALGLTLTGTGVCGVLAPLLTVWLIETQGWRAAYFGLALVPLLLALPLTWAFLKPRGLLHQGGAVRAVGLRLGQAAGQWRFWIILGSILAIYLAVSGIIPNLIPALTDGGMSAGRAATVQSVIGASIVIGRLVVGSWRAGCRSCAP